MRNNEAREGRRRWVTTAASGAFVAGAAVLLGGGAASAAPYPPVPIVPPGLGAPPIGQSIVPPAGAPLPGHVTVLPGMYPVQAQTGQGPSLERGGLGVESWTIALGAFVIAAGATVAVRRTV